MKLRQKLAMVLASAMIVTAVPVTTMAASQNGFNKTLSIVADQEITSGSGLFLNVEYSDADKAAAAKGDVFFINATDFEFTKEAYNHTEDGKVVAGHTTSTGAKVEWLSKTQLKVTAEAGELAIAIVGTPKKGTPAITVDGEDSLATSGKYALTGSEVVTDKALVATAGSAKNISVDGEGQIADITVEEKTAGALKNGSVITVSLPNSSDLDFKLGSDIKVEGLRGLAGQDVKVKAQYRDNDKKVLELTVEGITSSTSRGGIKIKGIEVQAENPRYEVKTGEVKVTVKADKMEDAKLVVANVADFGVKLNVEEEVEVVAGKDGKTVKVTLEENAIASLNKRQDVYFELEGANIVKDTLKVTEGAEGILTQETEKDEVTGLTLDTAKLSDTKANKGKASQTGDVVLVASSRNFEKDIELKVGTVKEAVKVEAEAMTVKVGLKGQKGGKVVITETEAEMLPRGKEIVVEVAKDKANGIHVVDAKVEAKDVQIKNVKVEDGKVKFVIDRTSNELGTITITDIEVDTDRTVPEGEFDLTIGGSAISKHADDVITVKDFLVVGTPNTEDNNASNGLKKGTGIFKVGERKYTINGETKEMDAAPYISKANRVMVPVRYVSDVFGVNGKDVLFSKENGGTITIFAGSRVLQVVNGSNIALVNGVKVPMDEKVTIIDGRTYVPVGEMARLLDVEVEWSNETKTATFTNR